MNANADLTVNIYTEDLDGGGSWGPMRGATAEHQGGDRYLVKVTGLPPWTGLTALDGRRLEIGGKPSRQVRGSDWQNNTLEVEVLLDNENPAQAVWHTAKAVEFHRGGPVNQVAPLEAGDIFSFREDPDRRCVVLRITDREDGERRHVCYCDLSQPPHQNQDVDAQERHIRAQGIRVLHRASYVDPTIEDVIAARTPPHKVEILLDGEWKPFDNVTALDRGEHWTVVVRGLHSRTPTDPLNAAKLRINGIKSKLVYCNEGVTDTYGLYVVLEAAP